MLRSAAALAIVLLLAGCVPGEPVITPEPDPDATPVFASDEEALAAATEAYAKYLEVSDQILSEGGENPERLDAVATPAWQKLQLEGYAKAKANGLHSVGSTAFDSLTLEAYDPGAVNGEGLVRAYVCIDVSGVDVLNVEGESVVSTERPGRSPAELVFDWVNGDSPRLVVAEIEAWGGRDFCEQS